MDPLLGFLKRLDDVYRLMGNEEARANPQLPGLIELLTKPDGLPQYHAELETLKTQLETNGELSERMNRWIWPLGEGDVKRTLDLLGRLKHSLDMMLSMDQSCVICI